jgi:actin-like ATPase involved in cell morphogenesis
MTYAPQALDFATPRDYCLGVDLGTTFVAAAICDGGRPEMVTLGGRSVVIPSAVYLDDDGGLLCGEPAVHRSMSDPDRAARGFFKRRLGDPTPLRMGGETRSVTQLLAALLSEVLLVVTETEGVPPRQVMLTHPANWGPFRREVFAEVAELAGVDEHLTMTEPEAAAAHYAATRELAEGKLVAVYDLGGGTFDTTVLRAHQGGVEILGVPEGIERLGGIDFDNALFDHLDHLCDGQLSALNADDPRAAVTSARLKRDIVLAKEHLSVDPRASIPVFLPDRTFDVHVTRTAFEDLIRAHVESTVVALQRTLRSARVSADDLDAVLLVGGSSRIPLVAEMVTEALGRPAAVDTHPKYAVALGAAAIAAQVEPTRQTVGTAATRSAMPVGARDADSPRARPMTPLSAQSQVPVLEGHPHHLDGQRSITLEVGSSTSRMSVPSGVALIERLIAQDAAGDRNDGRSPLALVDTGHTLADPIAGQERTRPALAKVLVGALALAGLTGAGFLTHSPGPPVLDAAAPAQACTTDCDSGLPPSSSSRPSAPLPTGATDTTPAAVVHRRSPVPASNIPPTEPTTTLASDNPTVDRTHGGRTGTDKKTDKKSIGKKSNRTKSIGKKSGGKHRKSSYSSPLSDDIV